MAAHFIKSDTHGNQIFSIIYDERSEGGDLNQPMVSWASIESVSVQEAMDFVNAILDVCAQSQNIYAVLKND